MERLSKILARAGIASRRKCEQIIFDKRVKVNSVLALLPQTMVNPEVDKITIDDKPIAKEEKKVYFLLNKPTGYECTTAVDKKTVLSLFKENLRLFTVGRLDKDTSGLIIVTNDGHFAHRIMHPSNEVEKEYVIKVEQEITHNHLVKIATGVEIEGFFIKPTKVEKVRKGTVKIVIKEGKKHEVKHFIKSANLDLIELKRVRIGLLKLNSLPSGSYREMTKKEIALFS